MAEFLEKSKIKQYIKNFCKGLIADNRRFDPVDDCTLLCDVVNFAPAADVVSREKMKELCKEVLRLACTDIDVFLSEPEVRLIDANEAEKLMVKMLGDIYGE